MSNYQKNTKNNRMSRRHRLLMSAGIVSAMTGVGAIGALAQTTDEIIVTATKRAQSAQDVPISLVALDEEFLAVSAITDVEDLRSAVPALNVTTAIGGYGLPRIRGIGATGQGVGIENPVAVYVDGIYYASSFGVLQNTFDAKQVTVLKGPQGTLFGRNATGGLIQIDTLGPTDTFRAKGEVGYGNYNTAHVSGFVGGPINDVIGASLAIQYKDQADGYGQNLFTGNDVMKQDSFNLRAKLKFTPSDQTSVLLIGDAFDRNAVAPAFRPIGNNSQGLNVQDYIASQGGDPEYDIYADFDPAVKAKSWGLSGTVEHDFGGFLLKSITGYRDTELASSFDPDGTVTPFLRIYNTIEGQQFTQELNLISQGDGPLQWVVGGFYINDKSGEPDSRTTGIFTFGDNGYSDGVIESELNSYSAFVELTYAIGENTNLTGGLRYTSDDRTQSFYNIDFNGNVPPNGLLTTSPTVTVSEKYSEPTWRVSVDHRFSSDLMAYASYNRGFRSGGFVKGAFGGPPTTLTPELVDAFEVGLKSDLMDGRARFNAAGYYYDQSSVQVFQIISGNQLIENAQGAEIYGIDADFAFDVSSDFTMFGGFNYTDATYSSFTDATISIPFPLTADQANAIAARGETCRGTFGPPSSYQFRAGGNCLVYGDATGNRLQNTPDITLNIGAKYGVDTGLGRLELAGNLYHNGGYVVDANERVKVDSFETLSASATLRPNDNYYIRLWGRNLTDAYYFSQKGASNSADNGYPGSPRTYGIALGFDF